MHLAGVGRATFLGSVSRVPVVRAARRWTLTPGPRCANAPLRAEGLLVVFRQIEQRLSPRLSDDPASGELGRTRILRALIETYYASEPPTSAGGSS